MPEQHLDPFSPGGQFAANPQLYDYIHSITFGADGGIEMVDGAGQVLNTLVRGQFSAEQVEPDSFLLHLTDLVEIDPYYKLRWLRQTQEDTDARMKISFDEIPHEDRDVIRQVPPSSIMVEREEGLFVLQCQVVWRIDDEQEWPYLLARIRYRFATDPLLLYEENRQRNLYYQLEPPEPDTSVYYRMADIQRLTARELAEAGIAVEKDTSSSDDT